MTELERIRKMTAEEFVKEFGHNSLCYKVQSDHWEFCEKNAVCEGCLINFLNMETEGERDG